MKQLAGGVLRGESAHWLLEPNRHGERVTSQHGCVCVCVRKSEGGSEECVCFTECENGNVIEKVQEVKEKQKGGKRKSRLGDHARETFFFSPVNLLRVVLYRRASRSVCVLEVGRSERKKKKTSGMADSRAPRAGGPGITRH